MGRALEIAAEKIVGVLNKAGWRESQRFRLRCTHCEYAQETHSAISARHFDGTVDSSGHGYVAETRVVLLSPWASLAEIDAAEASE